MKKFILIIIFLTSCKPKEGFEYPSYKLTPYTDSSTLKDDYKINEPELVPYLDLFLSYAETYNTQVPDKQIFLAFDDLRSVDSHVLGKCIESSEGNAVVIDQEYWRQLSVTSKEIIMFHELGHCLLGRSHRTLYYQGINKKYDNGIIPDWEYSTHPNWPMSLMHRSFISEQKYNQEKEYYLLEIFNNN